MTEPDARAKIHALLESVFDQKSSGRTWGRITVEITFQEGRPTVGKVTDETSFKFDRTTAEHGPDRVPGRTQVANP